MHAVPVLRMQPVLGHSPFSSRNAEAAMPYHGLHQSYAYNHGGFLSGHGFDGTLKRLHRVEAAWGGIQLCDNAGCNGCHMKACCYLPAHGSEGNVMSNVIWRVSSRDRSTPSSCITGSCCWYGLLCCPSRCCVIMKRTVLNFAGPKKACSSDQNSTRASRHPHTVTAAAEKGLLWEAHRLATVTKNS